MSTQGKRLQRIRKTLNLTQEALGQALDVSKQVVSNIEADRVLLNNDKLVSLGKNFDVNIDYLLLGRGEIFIKSEKSTLKDEIRHVIKEMAASGELTRENFRI